MIGAFEDAEDYRAFEAAVTADYDAQSAVERELVLRLASLLWRLRRATAMETGLLQIQAERLTEFRQSRQFPALSHEPIYAAFGRRAEMLEEHESTNRAGAAHPDSVGVHNHNVDPTTEIARCFLRLANLPSSALDGLGRYEASLWRQVGQILFTLDALERRKPLERKRVWPTERLGSRGIIAV